MPIPTSKQLPSVTMQEQLPIWPQHMRGMSNALARSALFNVSNFRDNERARMDEHVIASLSGIRITYTGSELRQDDHDCFLQILHIARMHPLGTECKFKASQMINELSWTRNKGSYTRLRKCITRLTATAISVTVESPSKKQNYTGSLIRSFGWKDDDGEELREWEVLLEKEIITLFESHSYTRLNWEERVKLSPLEKWVHGFYATHAHPHPMNVSTIHNITGSKIAVDDLRKFRYKLKKALENMVALGIFETARINPLNDFVEIKRLPPTRRDLQVNER